MKFLEINTDSNLDLNLPDEPVENILISGHTINCFGHFFKDGRLDLMSMEIKDMTLWLWLLTQIKKYNANIDIECEKECFDYYINLLNWLDNNDVKHKIRLFKNF